ncbi:MAG: flagellar hook-associated protein FlgK [Candidatus Riflebacteria bacterium]|nr:flagellar hook-associated protein FlgK [Candidatus Riflebacteria bacterium]
MSATFFGLEICKRAILAQRGAMDVTSQNIANANTENYSRQQAVLGSVAPVGEQSFSSPLSQVQFGGGVDVNKIQNFRDSFIDTQITQETSNNEKSSVSDDLLKQVESVLNEPGSVTLRNQLDQFWNAWQNLSQDPSNVGLRTNLQQQSESLTKYINDLDGSLKKLQGDNTGIDQQSINNQLTDAVQQVNSLAKQIADLNVKIGKAEVSNGSANDLRDQRQTALESLAKLVNVDSEENSKGQLTVRVGKHTLVQQSDVNELYLTQEDGNSFPTVSSSPDYPSFTEKPEVASAILTHQGDYSNYTLTVAQLAQANKLNSYLTYNPTNSPLSTFGISSGSFSVNGKDFNLDASKTSLQGLTDLINSGGNNVKASVNEAGQLVIESALTGEANKITFKNGTSNITTILDMREQTAAKNSIFSMDGKQYTSAENSVSSAIPGVTINLNGIGTTNIDLQPIVTSGKIRGLLETRDGAIQTAIDQLDEFAYKLSTEVNDVHRSGFGLDGETGRNFFKSIVTTDPSKPYKDAAKNLSLEDGIVNNTNTIAAAAGVFTNPDDKLPSFSGEGDGSNAISIVNIKSNLSFSNGKTSFQQFSDNIVTQVATESQGTATEKQYSTDLLTQLNATRQSTMGVSIDEEMTNLIKTQQAYNAAAKVLQTMDQMLTTIVTGLKAG